MGTLTLSGVNTFSGPTYLDNGYLLVTGSLLSSGKVEVASGGDLWGSGTVGNVGCQFRGTALSECRRQQHDAQDGQGLVRLWLGNLYHCLRRPERQRASGSVDLSNGPTLNAQLGQFPTKIGGVYAIIQGAAIVGTFQGLPEHSKINIGGKVIQIHYSATSVVLTRNS